MRTWLVGGIAAVALAVGGGGAARACWMTCGPCFPVPVQYEYRTVTQYRTEYRTEYREVQRTVYRCVPETHEQEFRETVLVPHWREEQRQRTVCVPQTREETRQRTVLRCEWREEQRQQTVLVPETQMVE